MQAPTAIDRRFAVAPMMDWTDRHCRYFLRQLAPHALLYTEMVVSAAILHGDRRRLLDFDPAERPVALQLGGSDPRELAGAARIGAEYGYDEINLNCGCPSDRVQAGRFGACLMAEPELVADCVAAMREAVSVPVTVKTRIGIDQHDSYDFLRRFVETVAAAGCEVFIIHARKAWLKGLSPRENREIPPLRYEVPARLKREFPDLRIVLNGGIQTAEQVQRHLDNFDGVMIGREAYGNPWLLTEIERLLHGDAGLPAGREEAVARMRPYIRRQLAAGANLHHITRHMLGLFQGVPGARRWRRLLSERAPRRDAGVEVLEEALGALREAA